MSEQDGAASLVRSDALLADFKALIVKYDHEANDLLRLGKKHDKRRIHIEGIAEGIAYCMRQIEKANTTEQARAGSASPGSAGSAS